MHDLEKKAEELTAICLHRKEASATLDWIKAHPVSAGTIGGAGLGGIYSFLSRKENETLSDWIKPVLFGAVGGGTAGGAYSLGKNLFSEKKDSPEERKKKEEAAAAAAAADPTRNRTKDPTVAAAGAIGLPALYGAGGGAAYGAEEMLRRKFGPVIRERFMRAGFQPGSIRPKTINTLIRNFSDGRIVNKKTLLNFVDSYINAVKKAPRGVIDRLRLKLPVPSAGQIDRAAINSVLGRGSIDNTVRELLRDRMGDIVPNKPYTVNLPQGGKAVVKPKPKAALALAAEVMGVVPKTIRADPIFQNEIIKILEETGNVAIAEQKIAVLFERFNLSAPVSQRLSKVFVESFHPNSPRSLLNSFRGLVKGKGGHAALQEILTEEANAGRKAVRARAAVRAGKKPLWKKVVGGGTIGALLGALFALPDAVAQAKARAAKQ